jgi:hypothetical protein
LVINNLESIFRFTIELYFNIIFFFKCFCNAFSNLECQCIQFYIHFMFINSDGMQFCIIYHNLDNNNVCARFEHLHYISYNIYLFSFTKINCYTVPFVE